MKYFWSYITVFILFLAQTTLGVYIDIYGIAPNIVFVFAICYAMYNYPVRSAVLCVISGLLIDLYGCKTIGINALLYMYIGLGVSIFGGTLMKKNIWAVAFGTIIVSVLYQVAYLLFEYVLKADVSFWYGFLRIILPAAVYDGVVALGLSGWARWLSEEQIRGF